jgi:hypothetical protein
VLYQAAECAKVSHRTHLPTNAVTGPRISRLYKGAKAINFAVLARTSDI